MAYRDSEAPCRRRHSYSGIPTLRFPLVFVVARSLVSVPSAALHLIVVFGIFSVVRAFFRYLPCCVSLSVVVIRWFVFRGLRSYIVPSRAEDNGRLPASFCSFFRFSLHLSCGSFRGIRRSFVFTSCRRLRVERSVIAVSFRRGLALFVCSSTIVVFVNHFSLSFSCCRFVGTSVSCTVRTSVSCFTSVVPFGRVTLLSCARRGSSFFVVRSWQRFRHCGSCLR